MTACYLNDIMVIGRNHNEHKNNFNELLNKLKEYGLNYIKNVNFSKSLLNIVVIRYLKR